MLGRLGLQLAGGGDVGHQRQVHEDRVVAADLLAELPDGLEERQRLDIAHRPTDLGDHHVVPRRRPPDGVLDLVGDVRDHLHRRAEVLAAPFLVDDGLVDAAGGDVVLLSEGAIDEAFVVAEVEIGFGTVVGDEHLAVLERRHRPGIDIDVRIELLHRHAQAPFDEQSPKRSGGDPLAQRGDDAAGHEDELGRVGAAGHGTSFHGSDADLGERVGRRRITETNSGARLSQNACRGQLRTINQQLSDCSKWT